MATSKKSQSKKHVSQSTPNPNPIIATVAPPPSVTMPTAPLGFNPSTMAIPRGGGRVLAAVVAGAAGVSQEILASPTFGQDLGTKSLPRRSRRC